MRTYRSGTSNIHVSRSPVALGRFGSLVSKVIFDLYYSGEALNLLLATKRRSCQSCHRTRGSADTVVVPDVHSSHHIPTAVASEWHVTPGTADVTA